MNDYTDLHRVRVFGCPVYVLDPKLQDAKKIPKWSKRSWKGIFMGFSPRHSSTVALVLNPDTGYVTPQYHVVFDERFSTVLSGPQDELTLEQLDTFMLTGNDKHFAIESVEEEDSTPQWSCHLIWIILSFPQIIPSIVLWSNLLPALQLLLPMIKMPILLQ